MFTKFLRGILLVVAIILLTLPTLAQTGDTFRVTAQTLNARTGPGIEYEIVARLGRGGTYSILQYSPTRNWVLLDLGFGQAWAFRHLGVVTSNSITPVTSGATMMVVIPSAGQGGGFTPPVTYTYTPPVVNTFGQGGGFAPPVVTNNFFMPTITETGVDLSVTSTQAEFNSTVGVTATLRMRAEPTFDSRIVSAIPYDGRPTPLARNAMGTWILVDFEGAVGWVYFLYVSFPPAIDVVSLPIAA